MYLVVFFVWFFLSQQRVSSGIKEALKESTKTTDEEQLKKSLKGKYPRQYYEHLVVSVICLEKILLSFTKLYRLKVNSTKFV